MVLDYKYCRWCDCYVKRFSSHLRTRKHRLNFKGVPKGFAYLCETVKNDDAGAKATT